MFQISENKCRCDLFFIVKAVHGCINGGSLYCVIDKLRKTGDGFFKDMFPTNLHAEENKNGSVAINNDTSI